MKGWGRSHPSKLVGRQCSCVTKFLLVPKDGKASQYNAFDILYTYELDIAVVGRTYSIDLHILFLVIFQIVYPINP